MGVAGSEPKAVPVMLDCRVEALPACLNCPVPSMGLSCGLGKPVPSVSAPAAAWKADAPKHSRKGSQLLVRGKKGCGLPGSSTPACG